MNRQVAGSNNGYPMSVTRAPKPPIGLLPRSIADDARRFEVAAAILRYVEAGYPLPQEWVDEYNEPVKP
jgi:hypothetical protein